MIAVFTACDAMRAEPLYYSELCVYVQTYKELRRVL